MKHPETSPCIEELPDGRLRCRNKGVVFRADRQPIICCSSLIVVNAPNPGCKMAGIMRYLTTAGVDRLQRCREAECGLMLPVECSIRCVGMPGSKCGWIAEWAKRLNDPEWACPCWLSSSRSSDS